MEILKQLKIKTSALKRLKKQYILYQKQTKTLAQKLDALQKQGDDEDNMLNIQKNREFLEQSQLVQSNVKQKLVEAFQVLVAFLSENEGHEQIINSDDKQDAENTVLETQTFLEELD